jgi:hypothetical protein
MTRTTPLGAVTRGLVAGAIGTMAMDALLYWRYRRGGGKDDFLTWEFSKTVLTWDEAPAPAQVGRRLFEGLFQRELPDSQAKLVNNITHWAFGIVNGGAYGLLAGSLSNPRIAYGPAFGTGVWLSGYAVLPAAGLYKPIYEYDAKVLANDWSAHLLFGTTTAAAYRGLTEV